MNGNQGYVHDAKILGMALRSVEQQRVATTKEKGNEGEDNMEMNMDSKLASRDK